MAGAGKHPQGYYPALDGMRALAVCMVFAYHYGVPWLGLDREGWIGVDLFFVLSGFLITGILFDSRHRTHRLRDFYMRRVLRIFPLYYGLWLTLLLSGLYFHWQWNARYLLHMLHLGNYARYVFFDPSNIGHMDEIRNGSMHVRFALSAVQLGHLWSLCVEEQFYLVWPAVIFSRLNQRSLLRLCGVGVVAVILLRATLFYKAPAAWVAADFVYRFTWTRIDSFLIGGALALALRGPQKAWLSRHWQQIVWPAHGIFALFYLWMVVTPAPIGGATLLPFVAIPGFTLIAIWAAALILHATEPASAAYRLLNLKPLRSLGSISYGFYIYHYVLLQPFIALGLLFHTWSKPATAILAFTGSLVIASLSYRYFETPFLRLKSRFAHQTHKAPIAEPYVPFPIESSK